MKTCLRSTPPIRAGVARCGPKSARVAEKHQSDPAVEGFLALASARLAPRTVEAYRRDLAHLTAWLGRSPTDASSDDLAAYVAQLRADGLAPTTVELPKRRRTLPRTLSPAEVERLLDAAAGRRRDTSATVPSVSSSTEPA